MAKHEIIIKSDNPKDLIRQLKEVLDAFDLSTPPPPPAPTTTKTDRRCGACSSAMVEKTGVTKAGKPYHGIFCTMCDYVEWLK